MPLCPVALRLRIMSSDFDFSSVPKPVWHFCAFCCSNNTRPFKAAFRNYRAAVCKVSAKVTVTLAVGQNQAPMLFRHVSALSEELLRRQALSPQALAPKTVPRFRTNSSCTKVESITKVGFSNFQKCQHRFSSPSSWRQFYHFSTDDCIFPTTL